MGLVERAHGATLLLDEIGELSPAMQAKLLRVLETGEVTRVGASDSRRFDAARTRWRRPANTRGNKKEAARRLGISRRSLYRRLEKFGLAA